MTKFYYCPFCGNLMIKIQDSGITPICCGNQMQILEAGSQDGASEKHVPALDISSLCNDGIKKIDIRVGEKLHPMDPPHYIQFIVLETSSGISIQYLNPGDLPQATFYLSYGEHFKNAYSYCNIHGLWEK